MEAKDYMSRREIANLFECLMTGLMYHRPDNYVDYMIDCLNKIKVVGIDTVRWDMFLEAKRAKTPLPPISHANGLSREASLGEGGRGGSEPELKPSTPLPPIGSAVKEDTAGDGRAMHLKVPLFLVVGGPGSGKGSYCEALTEHFPGLSHISTGSLLRERAGPQYENAINAGELLPDEVVVPLLVDEIKAACEHAKGILLTGFPRSKSQVTLLEQKIGSIMQILLIDYEEEDLVYTLERRRNEGGRPDDAEEASERRVAIFKEQTLPVCKHFEDAGKLILIDGNRSRDVIIRDLVNALENEFGEPTAVQVKFASPRPPSVPRPAQKRPCQWDHEAVVEEEEVEEFAGLRIRKLHVKCKDTGRRGGLFKSPIILLMGGPGSGRSVQAAKIVARYGFVHLTIDSCCPSGDVLQRLRDLGDDVKGLVLEGYPASEQGLIDFYREIGGMTHAILIDCYENVLRQRCEAQGRLQPAVDDEIEKFKTHALPVVRHFDMTGLLTIVLGDQEMDEVFAEVAAVIDEKILQQESAQEPKAETEDAPAPDAAEATEAAAEEVQNEATEAAEEVAEEVKEEVKEETAEEVKEEVKEEAADAADGAAQEAPADAAAEAADEVKVEEATEVVAAATEEAPVEEAADQETGAAEEVTEDAAAAPADEAEKPAETEQASEEAKAETEETAKPEEEETAQPDEAKAEDEKKEADEKAEEPTPDGLEVKEGEVVPETATMLAQSPEEILKSLKVIFVIGGPGSGKGTQCEKILEHFQVGHVSTGDLMRAEVQSGSERGKKLKEVMEKGELVTLDTVLELLKDSLVKMGKDKKCFLVDGFPREKEQGVRFENEVTECSVCLFFDVPNDIMTERLLNRGKTSGRVDDNEETIRARLKTFTDNTDPILQYFEGKGKLSKIDATGTIDDIYGKVDKVIEGINVARK